MNETLTEVDNTKKEGLIRWLPLYSCKARYFYTRGHHVVLQSYYTVVASVDTETGECYDFSRYVYGYTATTAQHIRKFAYKMGASVVSFKDLT